MTWTCSQCPVIGSSLRSSPCYLEFCFMYGMFYNTDGFKLLKTVYSLNYIYIYIYIYTHKDPTFISYLRGNTKVCTSKINRLMIYLLLFSLHNSGINIPCISLQYMFRPMAAIIRSIKLLQSPFSLYVASIHTFRVHCSYVIKTFKLWTSIFENIEILVL
jgi:hypothetical protein